MLRPLPDWIEPRDWTLAFHRTSPHWWVRLLACGRYKHVSAFAYVPALRLWLFYDVTLSGTHLALVPDGEAALRHLAERTIDADLVSIRRSAQVYRRPRALPFSCVASLAHLIGARGALLRPDALWRYCLAHGGEVISDGARAQPDDRRRVATPAAQGAGGAHRGGARTA